MLPALLCLATAFLLHLSIGYRPFPSLDDYAYLPVFRHLQDPTIYSKDLVLASTTLHSFGWYVVYRLAGMTVGLPRGLWGATLVLSVATVAAVYRIARSLGGSTALLPALGVFALATSLHGVGRGVYDGAFGAAFHGQWLALCFLLFAYAAFLEDRHRVAGCFLGLTIFAHVPVAIHGAFAISFAALFAVAAWPVALLTVAGFAAAVGAPAIYSIISHLEPGVQATWSVQRIIQEGYRFRLPHEYTLDLGPAGNHGLALLLLAAVGAALTLRRTRPRAPVFRIAALGAAHVVLLLAAAVFYGPFASLSAIPYLLSLTRTSPVLAVLLSIVACVGMESILRDRLTGEQAPFQLVVDASLALAVFLLGYLFIDWNPALLGALALSATAGLVEERNRSCHRWGTALTMALVAVVVGLGLQTFRSDTLQTPESREEAQLYEWVRTSTALSSTFIIPPGFEAFRWFAGRSAYVDFKLFPPASLETIPSWRERLDDVASPDRRALAVEGWRAAREFDRCYARRNTPARIEELLQRTKVDYFVWDADGLRIPPLLEIRRVPTEGLTELFHNERFTVYRLGDSREHA